MEQLSADRGMQHQWPQAPVAPLWIGSQKAPREGRACQWDQKQLA